MFTEQELLFILDALNGVICTPETFAANLWGWVPYSSISIEPNILLGKVSRLNSWELNDLHAKIYDFWDANSIPSVKKRMEEVGLDTYLEK